MLKARRTSLLVAACCIVAAGITLALLQRKPERPDVKLVFLGYTNAVLKSVRTGPMGDSIESLVSLPKAIIGITNCGNSPVIPISRFQILRLLGSSMSPRNYAATPTPIIPPGEMAVATVFISGMDSEWNVDLAYTSETHAEKWVAKGKASKISALRSVAGLFPPAKVKWAQAVWVSNPPQPMSDDAPRSPPRRYNITAPPPSFRFENPAPQTNQQTL